MVSTNKTHIWNVTYMGIGIYHEVMSYKETSIASMSESMYIIDDMGIYAKNVKGDIKEKSIAAINSKPAIISNEYLRQAIERGTIEHYGGKMSSRPCTPLMNKWAQKVHDAYQNVLETLRMEWAMIHTGEFVHPNEDDFEGNSGIYKPVVPFIQPKANYFVDKKGRVGYNDDAINMNYKGNSEQLDPLNGEAAEYYILQVIARNRRAKEAGEWPKNKCVACGNTFRKKSNRQEMCPTCSKKVKALQQKEKKEQNRRLITENGTVPSRDQPFEKYAERAFIGMANGEPINKGNIKRDSVVKTSEPMLKGVEPERAGIDACECGSKNFEFYKPWKPEVEGQKFGKIGSRILYCKDCGLVVETVPQRSYPENGNSGYMGD